MRDDLLARAWGINAHPAVGAEVPVDGALDVHRVDGRRVVRAAPGFRIDLASIFRIHVENVDV